MSLTCPTPAIALGANVGQSLQLSQKEPTRSVGRLRFLDLAGVRWEIVQVKPRLRYEGQTTETRHLHLAHTCPGGQCQGVQVRHRETNEKLRDSVSPWLNP
jgi:hypothetical protein